MAPKSYPYHSQPQQKGSSHKCIKGEKEKDYIFKQVNTQENFINPDPWARLIGPSNDAPSYVDGKLVRCLLDTGAQVNFVGKDYCLARGWHIKPISQLIEWLSIWT